MGPMVAAARFLEDLGRLYRESPPLWQRDPDPDGFSWIDCTDHDQSILCYVRRDAADHLLVVLNLTPVPREDYRIGAPETGRYFPPAGSRCHTDGLSGPSLKGWGTRRSLRTRADGVAICPRHPTAWVKWSSIRRRASSARNLAMRVVGVKRAGRIRAADGYG